ncbi:hypothetical protein GCM10020000_26830 [Streptomyces olivoverticillatus]
MGWEAQTAIKANPAIEKEIGYFTIPGESASKPEGVFLGGSNLAIAEGSKKKDLAKEFLKIALSDKNEAALAKEVGPIPNKDALLTSLKGNAAAEAAAPRRQGRRHHPADPRVGRGGERPQPDQGLHDRRPERKVPGGRRQAGRGRHQQAPRPEAVAGEAATTSGFRTHRPGRCVRKPAQAPPFNRGEGGRRCQRRPKRRRPRPPPDRQGHRPAARLRPRGLAPGPSPIC